MLCVARIHFPARLLLTLMPLLNSPKPSKHGKAFIHGFCPSDVLLWISNKIHFRIQRIGFDVGKSQFELKIYLPIGIEGFSLYLLAAGNHSFWINNKHTHKAYRLIVAINSRRLVYTFILPPEISVNINGRLTWHGIRNYFVFWWVVFH